MTITIVDDTVLSETDNINFDVINAYKGLIISLEERIIELKEQLKFVKDDSDNKSTMINNLLAIVRHVIYDKPKERINSDESGSSGSTIISSDTVERESYVKKRHGETKKRQEERETKKLSSTEILYELMSTPIKKVSPPTDYYHFPRIDDEYVENGEQEDKGKKEDDNEVNEKEKEEDGKEEEEEVEEVVEEEEENKEEVYGPNVINSTSSSVLTCNADFSVLSNKSETSSKYHWEKYSNGFAGKMLNKMGFRGKGLGKCENGISEPIQIEKKSSFKKESNPETQNELIYVLSDSMFNQIDEKRLNVSKDVKVKVKSYGGCTINRLYKHLPEVLSLRPKYIVIHIGTNDCIQKTSDQVIREMMNLKRYIENALTTTVIFSTPITRSDNTTANQIVQNVNVKLKRMDCRLMDNSNIIACHLGKRGLHLNEHGTKKLAINLISLIKRL